MLRSNLLISLLAAIFMVGWIGGQAQATENIQPEWAGIYDIVITNSDRQQVPTAIDIKDLGNRQMEVTAAFEENSVTQLGDYSGDPDKEGLQAHFDINQFGVVKGSADFTIQKSEDQYKIINGHALLNSFAIGRVSGDFIGQQRGEAPAPAPAPSPQVKPPVQKTKSTGLIVLIAGAAGLMLTVIGLWSRKKRSSR